MILKYVKGHHIWHLHSNKHHLPDFNRQVIVIVIHTQIHNAGTVLKFLLIDYPFRQHCQPPIHYSLSLSLDSEPSFSYTCGYLLGFLLFFGGTLLPLSLSLSTQIRSTLRQKHCPFLFNSSPLVHFFSHCEVFGARKRTLLLLDNFSELQIAEEAFAFSLHILVGLGLFINLFWNPKNQSQQKMGINKTLFLTYFYLFIYILLSSGVILYNKWVLSPKYFNFPLPITLTMIHMGFSGAVAFLLVRVFKVVTPVKMTFEIYATCVVPISAFFASSLWFGNTAYLHISVAFIQMLKALMPVATFIMAVLCGTDKARCDVFLNMVLVSVGVVVSSYGEIHFNIIGTVYQVTGIFAEALRLVLTQVLLQKKGLTLNPITSLYYIAPCSFVFLFVPWYLLEKPVMEVSQIQFNFWIFFSNAICALALNFSIFLVIGRTGAVTIRVAGVLKDWILIALSTVIFPESTITGLNIIGYAIALCGVVMYNYIKVKDVRTSQSPADSLPDRITKDWKFEKKSSDIYTPDNISDDAGSNGGNVPTSERDIDEEAPLITSSSRLSHIGRTQLTNHPTGK